MDEKKATAEKMNESINKRRVLRSADITLPIKPMTVTAQQARWTVKNGKAVKYEPDTLKRARDQYTCALVDSRPDEAPFRGPISLQVVWSFQDKKLETPRFRTKRPDTDNLQKLLKDCMTAAGYWEDDAQVVAEHVYKVDVPVDPRIRIRIEELADE